MWAQWKNIVAQIIKCAIEYDGQVCHSAAKRVVSIASGNLPYDILARRLEIFEYPSSCEMFASVYFNSYILKPESPFSGIRFS